MQVAFLSMLALATALGFSAVASAQQSGATNPPAESARPAAALPSQIEGKWTFISHQSNRSYSDRFELKSLNLGTNGAVTGLFSIRTPNCTGNNVPFTGTYDGNKFTLTTTERVSSCGTATIDLQRVTAGNFKGTYSFSQFVGGGGQGGTNIAELTLPEAK